MSFFWPPIVLAAIVATLIWAHSQTHLKSFFRWLPVPLWCYGLPMILVAAGFLPQDHPSYRMLTREFLPFALALLLLGVELPALAKAGRQALAAAFVGTIGIIIGTAFWTSLMHSQLPSDAWKGAGTLAATWTGGSLNMLSLRAVLDVPDSIFTPLIVVDAIIAYGWMALLVAASAFQNPINRWLGAKTIPLSSVGVTTNAVVAGRRQAALVLCVLVALVLTVSVRWIAAWLPTTQFVSSATGWTILMVTTAALVLSFVPSIRRVSSNGSALGYPCLYLVLAAMGAQASLAALRSAPQWIILGFGVILFHVVFLLIAGRLWRIPLGFLATASQSNIGGFVSGPLVGAIYHPSLSAVGLILAMTGSALGTYVGWLAALLARVLAGGG